MENAKLQEQNILALLDKADRLAQRDTPLIRWGRRMARNSYTIDPARPAPVASDLARDRAIAKAKKLWQKFGNWRDGHAPALTRSALRSMMRRY